MYDTIKLFFNLYNMPTTLEIVFLTVSATFSKTGFHECVNLKNYMIQLAQCRCHLLQYLVN